MRLTATACINTTGDNGWVQTIWCLDMDAFMLFLICLLICICTTKFVFWIGAWKVQWLAITLLLANEFTRGGRYDHLCGRETDTKWEGLSRPGVAVEREASASHDERFEVLWTI